MPRNTSKWRRGKQEKSNGHTYVITTLRRRDIRQGLWHLPADAQSPAKRPSVIPSGDGYMQLLTPAFVWFSGSVLAPTYFVTLGLAMIIERAVYFVLKNTLKRLRPADFKSNFQSVITASDEFSFPSGHTSAAFCFSLITVTVLGGASALLFLWATIVGMSRLVLGVHFPGDVLAGAFVGSGVAMGTLSLLNM